MKRKVTATAIFVFLITLGIAFSESANHELDGKVDKEVENMLDEKDKVSVIVVLEDEYINANPKNDALPESSGDEFEAKKIMIQSQQEDVLSDLSGKGPKNFGIKNALFRKNEDAGFELEDRFTSVNGFSASVTKEGLQKLIENPDVKKVYPNREYKAFLNETKNIVNATNAWRLIYNNANLTGKGETVCVIDTGVDYTHSDMGNCASASNINDHSCAKVIGGYDFINNDQNPMDDHGHGTHVAGIIASTNTTYSGIAPDANIVAIKSLNSAGGGTTSTIVNGINWCVDNSSLLNITVISMSLGASQFSSYCDSDDATLTQAINNAAGKNISVIVATGNTNSNFPNATAGIGSPACIKNSTRVSATDKSDSIASYAFRHSNFPDIILAPGTSIKSLSNGGGTESQSGTSMAAPHVAAAFALIHQYFKLTENRNVLPNETQKYLNDTGKQISDAGGSGLAFSRINIFAAIASLDRASPNITITSPINNSAKTNLTFTVNAISSEVLANATLEINNTNYTMAGSGISWNVNITSLKNGTYTYLVYGNDSFGNRNISETFTVSIDLIPPYWSNNITNASGIGNIKKNDAVQLNITWNDSVGLSGFIFSWNDTGSWQNATNGSLNGKNNAVSVNKTIVSARGNAIGYKFYANDSVNNFNETDTWVFSVANTIPSVINLTINSSDEQNRTNATLTGAFSFSDIDNDAMMFNETKWYNKSEEVAELMNYTAITSNYTKKSQNWTFSARVFDGFNWSEWANSTKIAIKNAAPAINITIDSIAINETQKANITINASDIDNDVLSFTVNDTRFSLNNIYFTWNTTLNDAGNYAVNITVNDTELTDSKIISIFVLDARDLDNDGNPDFNDTDDDNDGILDGNDFLEGNSSSINTTFSINMTIGSTDNLSRMFNGTFLIVIATNASNNLTNSTLRLAEFEFPFNSSNVFDAGSITVNYSFSGFSAFSLRGVARPAANFTKNFTIDKVNTTAKAICIKDADAGFESISSNCDATNEFMVTCNNNTQGQYICYDTGSRYKIIGLNHSAVKELCIDKDGDKYGNGCALGSDCNDNDASKTTSCSSGDSGGSGSSGGGGGGGGGSGGGLFYTCNMDWSCTEWSACENGWQVRQCEFAKVPQHTQKEACPLQETPPEKAKKCQIAVSFEAAKEENTTAEKEAKIINQNNQTDAITGAATTKVKRRSKPLLKASFILLTMGILIYLVFFAGSKNKGKTLESSKKKQKKSSKDSENI